MAQGLWFSCRPCVFFCPRQQRSLRPLLPLPAEKSAPRNRRKADEGIGSYTKARISYNTPRFTCSIQKAAVSLHQKTKTIPSQTLTFSSCNHPLRRTGRNKNGAKIQFIQITAQFIQTKLFYLQNRKNRRTFAPSNDNKTSPTRQTEQITINLKDGLPT